MFFSLEIIFFKSEPKKGGYILGLGTDLKIFFFLFFLYLVCNQFDDFIVLEPDPH